MFTKNKKERALFEATQNENLSQLSEVLQYIEDLNKICSSLASAEDRKLFRDLFIPDINAMKKQGDSGWQITPLTNAADLHNELFVNALIAAKADVNKPDSDGTTPLMLAASRGHVGIIKSLLDAKAEVNSVDSQSDSALYFAAVKGHLKCIEVLLAAEENAHNPLAKQVNMNNALLVAAEGGKLDCIKLLLTAKADVNSFDNKGETAIIKLFRWNKKDAILKCLPIILEAKPNHHYYGSNNYGLLFSTEQNAAPFSAEKPSELLMPKI